MIRYLLHACLSLSLGTAAAWAKEYQPATAQGSVEVLYESMEDEDRARTLPVKLFVPEAGNQPHPVVLWSHGLGGSRDGADFLGYHLAAHGYVAVHLQHPGTDVSLWQAANSLQAMKKALEGNLSLKNFLDRIQDVEFALDWLTRSNRQPGALQGRLDLRRVGMSGHSYGAVTTQAVIGQQFRAEGHTEDFREDRIQAALLMSPSPPVAGQDAEFSFRQIRLPVLHVTGTQDQSPFDWFTPSDRRIPFDHMDRSRQYLLIFRDANHMAFSGHKAVPRYHDRLQAVSLAFWDAHLRNHSEALRWLESSSEGVTTILELGDTWELK